MDISEVVNNRWAQLAAASVVAFAGGAGVGYILARKFRPRIVEVIPEQLTFEKYHLEDGQTPEELGGWVEPESDEETVRAERVQHIIDDPEGFAEDLIDSIKSEGTDEEDEPEEALVNGEVIELRPKDDEDADEVDAAIAEAKSSHPTANVFDNSSKDWDYTKEVAGRSAETPYILHQDEYYADERGYSQTTLTYYAGDQILADEHDKPIYNYGAIVGELTFGHGTNDPNIVYIRNEALEAEYEVLLDSSSFEVSVLGFDADSTDGIEHSGVHKFRPED